MFITTKTHAAAIREKDEVIDGLMKRLETAQAREAALVAKCHAVLTRLAPFERQRSKGGRFVSVRNQFENECG